MQTVNLTGALDNSRIAKLEQEIQRLAERRTRMLGQKLALEAGLIAIDSRLKSLYAKRTVELNFKLDL
jgi:hypothetical protein